MMQFKILLILQFLAGIFGSKKLDTNWAQLAIDKYFQSKNSSASIQLPEFHLTEKDENCIVASADILRQAYNFLTKCQIGQKDKDCLDPNWAVRLLDSIPLLKPAGFFRRGPFYFLADYATCRKLPHDKTQYCRIKGALENVTTIDLPFTIGLCIPKACEAATLGRIAQVKIIGDKTRVDEMWCDDVAEPDATWQIYSLAGGFALASLILIATVLDKKKNFEKNLEHDDDDSIFGAIAPSIALTYRKFAKFSKKSIITAFSLKSSLKFLQRNSSREIPILNGLKVFTTFWVIFSHTCLFSLNFSDVVADVLKEARNRPILSAFLLNSSLAVDTFLLISGIVAAYSLRRKWQFRGGTQQMTVIRSCTMLLHRLFRYLPSLTIYMVFMVYLYNRLGDGPFWNGAGMFGSKCDSTWSILSHFVFASNFLPTQCVPWLWHVALDFQLYLIFPLLVLLLIKFPKFGWLPILGLIAICLIYRTLAFTVFDLPINIFTKMLSAQKFDRVIENTYRFVYTAPFSRAPPFFIGILTGWCFLAQPTALTISATKSAALQCLALTLLSASLFVSGNIPHAVLYRCAWSCGVAILITLAPGWLVFVLGSQRYVVLARLSFGVFLAHEPILLYRLNTLHQPISDFTLTNIIFQSLAIYVVSLGLAWILAMVIEIPLITLERRVFMGPQKLAVRQRRVSFSENGDTIFGDDEEEMVEEERVQTTRDEILGESEMKFDEKAKNWLKTCGILEADSKC